MGEIDAARRASMIRVDGKSPQSFSADYASCRDSKTVADPSEPSITPNENKIVCLGLSCHQGEYLVGVRGTRNT